ncbi:Nn.00g027740.m01.CDS01 [Neocucurbitaria sp. VM-36]
MAFLALLVTVALIATATAGIIAPVARQASSFSTSSCSEAASRLYLSDSPHDNYFYSDCHSSAHVIVTSPRPGSDLNIVKPRLLVAWPAGNSGALALFAPESGQDGTLAVRLENSTTNGEPLDPIDDSSRVGVSGSITFNDTARLTVPILGSIRAIRDFTEGGNLNQDFQGNFGFSLNYGGGATINRTWFDGVTTTWLTFTPLNGAKAVVLNKAATWTLTFGPGTYRFDASFNYPQLDQLGPSEVLTKSASSLISQNPDQTTSLSFLSYTDKLLAGTWRFLTYFGRDSMIWMLLMQPILSESAVEAVIGAVLERVNRTDGTVCHEEVLGDYATWLNRKEGITSSKPRCDYKMIDTDFYLPIAMKNYFVDTQEGQQRSKAFFAKTATFLSENNGLDYMQLAQLTAEKIMRNAAPFANNQVKENLIHLRDGEPVGEWRDSNQGLGGGRTPYNVNAALVPAGLRAIAALSRAGFFPSHSDWSDTADDYAQIWEDSTLQFFKVTIPQSTATSLVQNYASSISVPANTDSIKSDITYYGLALDAPNKPVVPVMNTDDCFRHFFLNTTNASQLSSFLSQTADHILAPFPVGLSSDVGLFVANPAYAGDQAFAANFSQQNYHGTVVWSWQLAMMGKGLARQLGRCNNANSEDDRSPDFCKDSELYGKIVEAYGRLWDIIEANQAQLSHEVWSWRYDGGYKVVQLGDLVTTESNVRQLWSLTFLAVHREDFGS